MRSQQASGQRDSIDAPAATVPHSCSRPTTKEIRVGFAGLPAAFADWVGRQRFACLPDALPIFLVVTVIFDTDLIFGPAYGSAPVCYARLDLVEVRG